MVLKKPVSKILDGVAWSLSDGAGKALGNDKTNVFPLIISDSWMLILDGFVLCA